MKIVIGVDLLKKKILNKNLYFVFTNLYVVDKVFGAIVLSCAQLAYKKTMNR